MASRFEARSAKRRPRFCSGKLLTMDDYADLRIRMHGWQTYSHRHVSEVPQPLAGVNVSALLAGGSLELGHQADGHPAAGF
jgi:hypothetical protein